VLALLALGWLGWIGFLIWVKRFFTAEKFVSENIA